MYRLIVLVVIFVVVVVVVIVVVIVVIVAVVLKTQRKRRLLANRAVCDRDVESRKARACAAPDATPTIATPIKSNATQPCEVVSAASLFSLSLFLSFIYQPKTEAATLRLRHHPPNNPSSPSFPPPISFQHKFQSISFFVCLF